MCLTAARYGIAWGAVGAAMACYDEAVSYAKTRVMFGKPIGGFQLQQLRLAEMLSEITKAQLLCLQLGRLKDAGNRRPSRFPWPSAQRQHGDRCRPGGTPAARRQRHPGRIPVDAALANLESVYTYEGTHDIHTLILGQEITAERVQLA